MCKQQVLLISPMLAIVGAVCCAVCWPQLLRSWSEADVLCVCKHPANRCTRCDSGCLLVLCKLLHATCWAAMRIVNCNIYSCGCMPFIVAQLCGSLLAGAMLRPPVSD